LFSCVRRIRKPFKTRAFLVALIQLMREPFRTSLSSNRSLTPSGGTSASPNTGHARSASGSSPKELPSPDGESSARSMEESATKVTKPKIFSIAKAHPLRILLAVRTPPGMLRCHVVVCVLADESLCLFVLFSVEQEDNLINQVSLRDGGTLFCYDGTWSVLMLCCIFPVVSTLCRR
jgi:hypothetical protein